MEPLSVTTGPSQLVQLEPDDGCHEEHPEEQEDEDDRRGEDGAEQTGEEDTERAEQQDRQRADGEFGGRTVARPRRA